MLFVRENPSIIEWIKWMINRHTPMTCWKPPTPRRASGPILGVATAPGSGIHHVEAELHRRVGRSALRGRGARGAQKRQGRQGKKHLENWLRRKGSRNKGRQCCGDQTGVLLDLSLSPSPSQRVQAEGEQVLDAFKEFKDHDIHD